MYNELLQYSARTFRPHVQGLLKEFGGEIPRVQKHPHSCELARINAPDVMSKLEFDDCVCLPKQWIPGTRAGLKALEEFCTKQRILAYSERNNPMSPGQSGLSPWLHFGQLSTQRCLLNVRKLGPAVKLGAVAAAAQDSYVEELVVRRELAENFTFYNAKYDEIAGAPKWAQDSLAAHRGDKREHIYALGQLESSKTHDELWNAAQRQLVGFGKMHGFLRMYWAKKILEWTRSAESALHISLHLNDKYSLDGTEPSGVVGCMWSIAGVHDQGWAERPIFGKIRYMNLAGCKRKFPVADFVNRILGTAPMLSPLKTENTRSKSGESKL